jgi:(p)ppGpp synthase/HD superfamily hydrolase
VLPISPRFQDALAFAVSLHADHVRKASGVPYIAHLLSVAALAMEHGAGDDEAIAALLHDAVEDRGKAARQALVELQLV